MKSNYKPHYKWVRVVPWVHVAQHTHRKHAPAEYMDVLTGQVHTYLPTRGGALIVLERIG